MKSLFKALGALCIILTCVSCSWGDCALELLGFGRAWIEGDEHKHFDSKAQKHSFRVLTGCGHTKRAGKGWDVLGLGFPGTPYDKKFVDKVERLPNGDRRISTDWVSFLVTEGATIIEVEIQENTTGKARSISFITTKYSTLGPSFTITQGAE